jgi:NTP pyrophosphatase (non-canonical NTP hydrolase)
MTAAPPETRTLAAFAAACLGHLRKHFDVSLEIQLIQLGAETGEALDAYGRFAGFKRRGGTLAEVGAELADVIITAYITAALLGADLDAALARALPVRGFPPGEQAVWLLKEAGAAADAYLLWDAMSRLGGRHLANVTDRLANVVTTAAGLASLLGIDLDAAWRAKALIIVSRGWKEAGPA